MGLMGRAGKVAAGLALSTSVLFVCLAPLARAASALTPTRPAATRSLDLLLPLRADLNGLRRFALAVTNPASSGYGAYRSIPWLSSRFGAPPGTRVRVAATWAGRGPRTSGST